MEKKITFLLFICATIALTLLFTKCVNKDTETIKSKKLDRLEANLLGRLGPIVHYKMNLDRINRTMKLVYPDTADTSVTIYLDDVYFKHTDEWGGDDIWVFCKNKGEDCIVKRYITSVYVVKGTYDTYSKKSQKLAPYTETLFNMLKEYQELTKIEK